MIIDLSILDQLSIILDVSIPGVHVMSITDMFISDMSNPDMSIPNLLPMIYDLSIPYQ